MSDAAEPFRAAIHTKVAEEITGLQPILRRIALTQSGA